jgi:small subunit ribosomal protein S1
LEENEMAQAYLPEGWHKNNLDDFQTTSYEERIKQLKDAMEKGLVLEGIVVGKDKENNILLNLGSGVKGIIPNDEAVASSNTKNPSLKNLNHNRVQFVIKEITDEYVIGSRKDAEVQVRNWMYQNLKKGMILSGIVKNIEQFGVFVEIGAGVVGLLHIEDISVARIRHPKEKFKIGSKIKVIVKSFDKNTGKIIFTHKELLGKWEDNIKEFKENSVVNGIARNNDKNGIFVELRPNLVGLAEFKSGVLYGQKVNVRIKKIIPDKKKIKLVILD